MRFWGSALLFSLLAAAPGGAALAQQKYEVIDHAGEYRACMMLARRNPQDALASALTWARKAGGQAAEHCVAVALLGLEHYAEAARRFEALADTMEDRPNSLRAEVLGQAGQAWVLADDLEQAHSAQSAALTFNPKNHELWVDRALTLALAENYWEAIDDLNEAESLAPNRPDILIFRASAYRYVDALELALEDAERGLSLDPVNPEGLLERGLIQRLKGDEAGAREDWLRVVSLAEGSPSADAARENLAQLDVKVE